MERVGALINRLLQQYSDKADESSLLTTTMLLLKELQNKNHSNGAALPGKVSVIMPYQPFELPMQNGNEADKKKEEAVEHKPFLQPLEDANLQHVNEEIILPSITQFEPVQTSSINTLAEEKYNDMLEHIPTLPQQPKVIYELNDAAQTGERSINDTLKTRTVETATKLQDEPIKDLRKAIGINDKYLFVKELFRNDEAVYERSIKTINSFHILPEAEYWIQRELMYKLGWDDNNSTVQLFYQLVRRRFSSI